MKVDKKGFLLMDVLVAAAFMGIITVTLFPTVAFLLRRNSATQATVEANLLIQEGIEGRIANIKRLRKEEEQAIQFRTEFKQLFPGIEPKRNLKNNSLDSLKDKIKDKKLKDFFGKFRDWTEKKDRL
jgi:type II secretory pathway pseudopilin PulG